MNEPGDSARPAAPAGDRDADAAATRRQEDVARLQQALAAAARAPDTIDDLLAGFEEDFFIVEDGWRSAFADFRARPGRATTLEVLALQEYLRFLRSRRARLPPAPRRTDPAERSTAGHVAGAAAPAAHLSTRGPETADGPPIDHERLPANEPVRVSGAGDTVRLWLASHRFDLVLRPRPALIDRNGHHHPLAEGRQVIVRAPYNDVVIDSDHAELSRQHLIVDVVDGRVHTAMDISSHGSFLPRHAIGRDY